jgi:hypothetical protein
MAYARTNELIARSGYSGVGDFWDTLEDVGSGVLKVYNAGQQASGAAQANKDLAAALAAQHGGISTGTWLMIGAFGIGAVLLITRKK